jgi:phage terminase small subunit
MVLEHWMDVAYADPNELMQIRRLNCRFCHGIDHQYQWIDEEEYERACESARSEAESKSKESGEEVFPGMPSDTGGYGFNKLVDPNKNCPKCLGEGKVDLHIADTRKISMQARRLFAGVKQTQSGVEIKFRDQDKAMENIARHLGMFKDEVKHTGEINLTFEDQLRDLIK